MAVQNVCRYNKFGYCRFGEICRKHHVDEVCVDSSCDPSNCDKRHPKECKYYKNYNRCKFNPCKFLHTTQVNYDEKFKEISENIESNKVSIELEIKKIDEKIDLLDREIKAREGISLEGYENKFEIFESNLITMKKIRKGYIYK